MMNKNDNEHQTGNSALIATSLARERSREAADRTLMAWIRTSLALIGFGFGINKVYDYLEIVTTHASLDKIIGTVIFGGAFMTLGTFGLLGALLQYRITLKRIKSNNYEYAPVVPLSEIIAVCLLLIGLFTMAELVIKMD